MSIDDELRIFEPVIHDDERGHFYESYNQRTFDDWLGREIRFVQDNQSMSVRGVIRGLHYQLPPAAQAKLVRVIHGRVFDVAVDIRRSSQTFGEWRGFELSEANRRQLWIPEGFAHGFLCLSDQAVVHYKTTEFYTPGLDRAIRWNDSAIAIGWPLVDTSPIVGGRDADSPSLADAEVFN
jgi:dTDP-4-dehydrorhamnose 3,5-epimerase